MFILLKCYIFFLMKSTVYTELIICHLIGLKHINSQFRNDSFIFINILILNFLVCILYFQSTIYMYLIVILIITENIYACMYRPRYLTNYGPNRPMISHNGQVTDKTSPGLDRSENGLSQIRHVTADQT